MNASFSRVSRGPWAVREKVASGVQLFGLCNGLAEIVVARAIDATLLSKPCSRRRGP